MFFDEGLPGSAGEVLIELLDPAFERPIKSWNFPHRTVITIGRSEGQDVEVANAYVSRSHAQLVKRDDQWFLVSVGRNGVLVGEQPIAELPLKNEMKFRLGSNGPCLRFSLSSKKLESVQTICFDTIPVPVFQVDSAKVESEVEAIAEGDYFQQLQQKVRDLRKPREPG